MITLGEFCDLFREDVPVKIYEPDAPENVADSGDLNCILAETPDYENRVIDSIAPPHAFTYQPFLSITLKKRR